MNGSNSIKTENLNAIPVNDPTKFRLNEINKMRLFLLEIQERKIISKKLSKYIADFDYADKIFILLSASFGTLSIVSHATVVGIPVGLASASLTVAFSNNRNSKEIIKRDKEKKKKHNKVVILAKSKLNSIEKLMSQALIDISHEEFKTIVSEKEKYEQMKETIRNTKSRDELSENSRDIEENNENA